MQFSDALQHIIDHPRDNGSLFHIDVYKAPIEEELEEELNEEPISDWLTEDNEPNNTAEPTNASIAEVPSEEIEEVVLEDEESIISTSMLLSSFSFTSEQSLLILAVTISFFAMLT